jgi:FkbM family methyltransferase
VLERQPMQALDVFAPSRNEEHHDWIDLIEAASRARGPLTVAELGAGHGRWLVHAANLARRTGQPLGLLVGCEAEPTHFAWMQEHFRDNGLDPAAHRLVQAAVGATAGTVPFYVGAASSWYGQSVADNVLRFGRGPLANLPGFLRRLFGRERPQDLVRSVRAVTLEELLRDAGTVDFLHMDIQGAEYDVLAASMDLMDRQVRLAHIGTHSPGAEATRGRDMDALVHELFSAHGWTARVRIAPEATHPVEGVPVKFVDGVQSWLNPRL